LKRQAAFLQQLLTFSTENESILADIVKVAEKEVEGHRLVTRLAADNGVKIKLHLAQCRCLPFLMFSTGEAFFTRSPLFPDL
jgi:hypothetical protein